MKKLRYLFLMLCMSAQMGSSGIAADDQPAVVRDGVRITVQYDPQGPNHWIVIAFVVLMAGMMFYSMERFERRTH